LGIGDILFQKRAYLPAIVAYRRVTQLAPENPVGFHRLGIALQSRERRREAITAWQSALNLYEQQGNQLGAKTIESLLGDDRNDDPFRPFN
jgi:tetratricopeptide (TPR) repeat protein